MEANGTRHGGTTMTTITLEELAARFDHWLQLERAAERSYGYSDDVTKFYRSKRVKVEQLGRMLNFI